MPLLRGMSKFGSDTGTLVSTLEKEAIRCNMEPTLSLSWISSWSISLLISIWSDREGEAGATWTTWGLEATLNCGVWAGDRGTGDSLMLGTGIALGGVIGSFFSMMMLLLLLWAMGRSVLSRLLMNAEGLAETVGLLDSMWNLGGGLGAPEDSVWDLKTKLSRSRGNLLRRTGSLGLGDWLLMEESFAKVMLFWLLWGLHCGPVLVNRDPGEITLLIPAVSIWRSKDGMDPWLIPMDSVGMTRGPSSSEWNMFPCEENFFRAGLPKHWALNSPTLTWLWGGLV